MKNISWKFNFELLNIIKINSEVSVSIPEKDNKNHKPQLELKPTADNVIPFPRR